MTIGYISQEISPEHISVDDIDQILSQLTSNLNDPDLEIVKIAVCSLLNFIIYARKNMTVDKEREYILRSIFSCFGREDVEVRIYAMQCLVEISRIYYDYIGSHIDEIIQLTKNHVYNINLDDSG